MDIKQINSVSEEMTLNATVNERPSDTSIEVDSGPSTQPTQPTHPIHPTHPIQPTHPTHPTPPPVIRYTSEPPPILPRGSPPIIRYASGITPVLSRGPPPSYEEAIDPNAPPPSYESLFGRVKEAQKSIFDFLQNILILFLGTIGCTIILGITMIIPISMMIIGGMYLYDCPQGEYIPVYLLVGGAFGVFKQLLHICAKWHRRHEEEEIRQSATQMLINCFITGWFIIGSMWVYKEYEPNYDPSAGKYCNKTLYLFAFWLITLAYILLAINILWICGFSLIFICFQKFL